MTSHLTRLPPLLVGTSHLGSVLPDLLMPASARARAFRYLDELVDLGCTAFDLAASYMIGGTERLFGHWLRSRRGSSGLFLISKGGLPLPVLRPNRLTRGALVADLEGTLARLGVERLDLFMLHRDHPNADLETIVAFLSDEQRRGRIGAFGLSNWRHERIARLQKVADGLGREKAVASSVHFSLATWGIPPWRGAVSVAGESEAEARAFYRDTGLPVIAWSPLAHGFLAGEHSPARGSGGGVYGNTINHQRRERARLLAERRGAGTTTAQIALAYLFSQPFAVHVIVGSHRIEHMRRNLEATSLRLTTEEIIFLESGASPPATSY